MIDLLKSDNVKEDFLKQIIEKLKDLKEKNKELTINSLKEKSPQMILNLLSDLKKSGEDRKLLIKFTLYLNEQAKTEAAREAIYNSFKEFENKVVENELNFFLNMAAKSFGVVNLEEGAEIFQEKLAAFLEDVSKNEKTQDDILNLIHEKANNFLTSEEYFNDRQKFITEIFATLSLEKKVENILNNTVDNELIKFLNIEYDGMINLIENDLHIRNIFEHLIYDMVARSALYAQGKMGEIVNDAIGTLTDEELNRIVYEKVEDDLLWIRMNGSIVGSVVGAVLFVVMKII